MKRRAFTLIEVMVAIVILVIASGIVGLRMHKAIEKKKFQSELERLRIRFTVSQRLATAMQADWKGTLKREGKGWIFETACEEVSGKRLALLHLEPFEIFFNGKRVRELTIDFFCSGYTFPEGIFVFERGEEKSEWKTSDLFLRNEGRKLGPVHPND
jgi:prepilin-type N-terminal cleavage/methylation domain-containing protein